MCVCVILTLLQILTWPFGPSALWALAHFLERGSMFRPSGLLAMHDRWT